MSTKREVTTADFDGCNSLHVEATIESPDYKPTTTLRLRDEGGTVWEVEIDGKDIGSPSEIVIRLHGSSEAATFADALAFAADTLRKQKQEAQGNNESLGLANVSRYMTEKGFAFSCGRCGTTAEVSMPAEGLGPLLKAFLAAHVHAPTNLSEK